MGNPPYPNLYHSSTSATALRLLLRALGSAAPERVSYNAILTIAKLRSRQIRIGALDKVYNQITQTLTRLHYYLMRLVLNVSLAS